MRWTESQQLEIEAINARIADVDPIVLQIVEGTLNSIEAEIEFAVERMARSPFHRVMIPKVRGPITPTITILAMHKDADTDTHVIKVLPLSHRSMHQSRAATEIDGELCECLQLC